MLCDVSGSVANFAQFTLLLVFALRDQFQKVRAFTFIDHVHEVTDHFRPGADVADVMADLAASTVARRAVGPHQLRAGVHEVRRAVRRRARPEVVAADPGRRPLQLQRPVACRCCEDLAGAARHAWWLNPEHPRHWDTGDSAAGAYGDVVPMVECRNLTQLGEFVHDLGLTASRLSRRGSRRPWSRSISALSSGWAALSAARPPAT